MFQLPREVSHQDPSCFSRAPGGHRKEKLGTGFAKAPVMASNPGTSSENIENIGLWVKTYIALVNIKIAGIYGWENPTNIDNNRF